MHYKNYQEEEDVSQEVYFYHCVFSNIHCVLKHFLSGKETSRWGMLQSKPGRADRNQLPAGKDFGVNLPPYFADTNHFNTPESLFIDSSDNLFLPTIRRQP